MRGMIRNEKLSKKKKKKKWENADGTEVEDEVSHYGQSFVRRLVSHFNLVRVWGTKFL